MDLVMHGWISVVLVLLIQKSSVSAEVTLTAPSEYTVFTGTITITYSGLNLTKPVFRIVELPAEIVKDSFHLNARYESGEFEVQCGSLDYAGEFAFQIIEYTTKALIKQTLITVRWPDFVLTIPPSQETLSSDVVVQFEVKDQLKCNSIYHDTKYKFEVVWYIEPSDLSSVETIDEVEVSQFLNLVNDPVKFDCSLFDNAGIYQIVFKSNKDVRQHIATSGMMEVTWNNIYAISTVEDHILPCSESLKVYYSQPRCTGQNDKIRLFKQETQVDSSDAERIEKYVAEFRAVVWGNSVSFPCDVFDDTAIGYCFRYISTARNGAVKNQDSRCLSTKFQNCDEGQYGDWCKNCPSTCRNPLECDRVEGHCSSCADGYTGAMCANGCSTGKHGENCVHNCSQHCIGLTCDGVSGSCDKGCDAGYKGDMCNQSCSTGKHGENCVHNCAQHCIGLTCDGVSGSCDKGCDAGYKGDMCNQKCNRGKFGHGCDYDCSPNCNKVTSECHHVTGYCLCAEGYKGNTCSRRCSEDQFEYGENCKSKCSKHCGGNGTCSGDTGVCHNPICKAGYVGIYCSTALASNWLIWIVIAVVIVAALIGTLSIIVYKKCRHTTAEVQQVEIEMADNHPNTRHSSAQVYMDINPLHMPAQVQVQAPRPPARRPEQTIDSGIYLTQAEAGADARIPGQQPRQNREEKQKTDSDAEYETQGEASDDDLPTYQAMMPHPPLSSKVKPVEYQKL